VPGRRHAHVAQGCVHGGNTRLVTDCRSAHRRKEPLAQIRAGVHTDRSQFFKDLAVPFYGANRPGNKVSEGLKESFWLQGMLAGYPAAYDCIKAFSETDFTEDCKKVDVPTLILHGDDDQIVPIAAAAELSVKLIKGARLDVIKGAPHGMCSTLKDEINARLSAFIAGSNGQAQRSGLEAAGTR